MAWPPADGTPYTPANGTEGEIFDDGWCAHCARDAAFRKSFAEGYGDVDGCQILAAGLFGENPKEWLWRKGEPICTAYTEDPSCPLRCPYTKEMFE